MNKTLVIVLSVVILAISNTPSISQKINVGKAYESVEAYRKFYFTSNNEVLIVNVENNNVMLQKFNTDLNITSTNAYTDFPKGSVIEKVLCFQNKYYVFYAFKNAEREQLFVREVNFQKGIFENVGYRVIESKDKLTGSLENHGFQSMVVKMKFSFYYASDSSRLLIMYKLAPKTRLDNIIIGVYVFDQTFARQWSEQLTIPFTEGMLRTFEYALDSKGNVYVLMLQNHNDFPREVLKVSAGSLAFTRYIISIPEFRVRSYSLIENLAGEVVCAGLYQVLNYDEPCGFFSMKLLDDGQLSKPLIYEIPTLLANQNETSGTISRNEKRYKKYNANPIHGLYTRQMLRQHDGGILINSEQQLTEPNGKTYTYYYNDILLLKLKESGALDFMCKVPKRQFGYYQSRNGLSYHYSATRENINIIFLDVEANKNLLVDMEPAYYKDRQDGILSMVTVDGKSGKASKKSLFNTKDVGGAGISDISVEQILKTTQDEYVFEAKRNGRENILVKITR